MTTRGKLIVVEGIIDSRNKALAKKIADWLRVSARKVVLQIKEPGGTEIGEWVNDRIMYSDHHRSPKTETYMFSLSRQAMLDDVVESELAKGNWVVLERYYYSTEVYQGHALGELDLVLDLIEMSKWPKPDLAFFINLPWETIKVETHQDSVVKKGRFCIPKTCQPVQPGMWEAVYAGYNKILPKYDELVSIDGRLVEKDLLEDVCYRLAERFHDEMN